MTNWLHRVQHAVRWQFGHVVTALDDHGTVWIGFRCSRCGEITGIHASFQDRPPLERFS